MSDDIDIDGLLPPEDEDVKYYRYADQVAPLVFEALEIPETNIIKEAVLFETTLANMGLIINYAHQLGARTTRSCQ